MTAYGRGYDFERNVTADLHREGYFVMESRGSHGLADHAAFKPGQQLLVQSKGGEKKITSGEWNELFELATRLRVIPVLADRPKRGVIRYRRITGSHNPHSHTWPCEPFLLDEVA